MTESAAPKLSIVIPAYNESRRLPESLDSIRAYLTEGAERGETAETIVVDDGSTDGTAELVEARAADWPGTLRVIRKERNSGKGDSIKRGMLAATGEWRLFTDADLSTPITELQKFWDVTERGAEVVIGSRALPESDVAVHQSWLRERMGRTFNWIIQTIGIRGIRDTQCGFKLFSAAAAEAIFPPMTIDGFAFDVEALLRARKAGFEIAEIPVRWVNSPDSRVRIVRDSLKMLWDVILLRFRL